ncbi:hypothetical protein Mgra_00009970 [Meloidogyne graminicola]|uniref:Protein-tyrosine phosphatase n=2 Tax=Meloidogyne graminicola TaxID=189291 RepID=A0A8S9Z8Q5_9BILA|nr:hypothetical protein Mgra_00009970 [Meloidogyne graminicola]
MDKRNNVTAGREGGPRTSRQSSAPTRSSERRRGGGGSRPRSRGSRSSESRRQGGPERRDRERNERPRTVEDSNEEKVFLDQLQEWAQETSRKQLTDLEAEFERLQNLPRPEPSPEFVRNPTLNRYRDVICVENNRVTLSNGHYIHANWIDSQGDRRYICTQGPLPQTVGDFWEMVLQEKVEAVVMLCDTVELNRPKCHQYWPKDNSPDSAITSRDGNIKVRFVDTEALDDNHLIRTRLQVSSDNPKRQANVRHFHWRRWPDRGVPMNHLAALRLLFYIGKYKPIVVHCSAGIGRTGTIVMIYLAQNALRAGQRLDFYELVADLRRQRAGSVQTLDQYLYIYSVFLRYAKNKAEGGKIRVDVEAIDKLIQAISKRIYKPPRR